MKEITSLKGHLDLIIPKGVEAIQKARRLTLRVQQYIKVHKATYNVARPKPSKGYVMLHKPQIKQVFLDYVCYSCMGSATVDT